MTNQMNVSLKWLRSEKNQDLQVALSGYLVNKIAFRTKKASKKPVCEMHDDEIREMHDDDDDDDDPFFLLFKFQTATTFSTQSTNRTKQ
jgi:hypothetical protein